MRLITAFTFVLLGCNYLLPFNTFINTFSYMEKTNLSPFVMISILNVLYQVAAIATNGIMAGRNDQFVGHELSLGNASILGVCGTTLCMIICSIAALKGISLTLILCACVILQSACSSVFDAINVHFTNKMGQNTILYYTMGINVSGTLHAAILVILNFVTLPSNWSLITGYYLTTLLLLTLSFVVYSTQFRNIGNSTPPVPRRNESLEETNNIGWWPARYYLCLIFINFVATLTIYPTMLVRLNTKLFPLYNEVSVFFLFNAAALCGNLRATWNPTENIYTMVVITLFRCCVLLPLGICYHFIVKELSYTILTIVCACNALFAYTSGYVTSSIYYQAPKTVDVASRVLVLRWLNFTLSIGLFWGSSIAFGIELVKKYNGI